MFWVDIPRAIVLLWRMMSVSWVYDFGLDSTVEKTVINSADSCRDTDLIYRQPWSIAVGLFDWEIWSQVYELKSSIKKTWNKTPSSQSLTESSKILIKCLWRTKKNCLRLQMSFNCAFCSSGRIPAEREPCEKAQAADHFYHIGTKLSIWWSHFVMLLPPQMLVFKMSKLCLDYKGREGSEINNSFGKEKHKSHLSLRLGQFAMLLLLWEIFFTPSLLRRLFTGRGKCFPPRQKVKNKYQNNPPWGLLGRFFWEYCDGEKEVRGEKKQI